MKGRDARESDQRRRSLVEEGPVNEHTSTGIGDQGRVADVRLRDVTQDDLPVLFEQQLDPEANYMAAFTSRDPADRDAFMAHWARILADETIVKQIILAEGQVAGNIGSFLDEGRREVGYWLGKEFWGRGIATRALAAFLQMIPERPLYARVATDNVGSLRVLQKCGFTICDKDKGFASARGAEIEEYVLILRARDASEEG
jgi:RimJ/RimL family protein N-acetyltransferase